MRPMRLTHSPTVAIFGPVRVPPSDEIEKRSMVRGAGVVFEREGQETKIVENTCKGRRLQPFCISRNGRMNEVSLDTRQFQG